MRIGTAHFISRAAANRYYAPMGYSPRDVGAKLMSGEIFIGRPERKAGQSVGVIPGEGRYYLLWENATSVPMGRTTNTGDC